MPAVVLFLNDRADDPTKRLKLAGVRRYAAAAGWNVVPIQQERSGRKSIPGLLAKYRPAGCICSEDDSPAGLSPRMFGEIPLVLANEHRRRYDALCGRVCVDNAAVARAAFRELSSGNPEAFAVVTEATSHEWSAVRVRTFRAEAANTGHSCPVYREIRCSLRLLPARMAQAQRPAVTRCKLFAEKVHFPWSEAVQWPRWLTSCPEARFRRRVR